MLFDILEGLCYWANGYTEKARDNEQERCDKFSGFAKIALQRCHWAPDSKQKDRCSLENPDGLLG